MECCKELSQVTTEILGDVMSLVEISAGSDMGEVWVKSVCCNRLHLIQVKLKGVLQLMQRAAKETPFAVFS